MADQLTAKQEIFARHYVDTLNGTEAARLAGYKGSDSVLAVTAHDNLRKPNIRIKVAILFRDRVITPEELLAWTQENMTRWKCPKYIELIDELPKTNVGKVMRRTLQEADPLFKKE